MVFRRKNDDKKLYSPPSSAPSSFISRDIGTPIASKFASNTAPSTPHVSSIPLNLPLTLTSNNILNLNDNNNNSNNSNNNNNLSIVPKGLSNGIGQNNCFLNVVIQCLFHLAPFKSRFEVWASTSHKHKHDDPNKTFKDDYPCMVCALASLFVEYSCEESGVVNPDTMRTALSNIGLAEKRFQLGQLGDAVEALEILLEYLHKEASQQESDNCSPTCLVHEVFGMNIVAQLTCKRQACGATGEPFTHNISIVYASTAAIRAYQTTHPFAPFEEILYETSQDLPQTCPNKFCSEKAPICRLLLSPPPLVLSIGLAWDQANASNSMISFIIPNIPLTIDLKYLYPNLASPVPYRLCGIVGYYGLHYNYYASPTKNSPWYIFDDAIVREIGGGWEGVVDKMLKGRIQPSILFYEKLNMNSKQPTPPVSQPPTQPPTPSTRNSLQSSKHSSPFISPRLPESLLDFTPSTPHSHRMSKDSNPIEIFAQFQTSYNTTSSQPLTPTSATSSNANMNINNYNNYNNSNNSSNNNNNYNYTSNNNDNNNNNNNNNNNINNNNNNNNNNSSSNSSSFSSSKNSTHTTTLSKTATLRSRSVPKIRPIVMDDERESIPEQKKKESLPPSITKPTDSKPPTFLSTTTTSSSLSTPPTQNTTTSNISKTIPSYTPPLHSSSSLSSKYPSRESMVSIYDKPSIGKSTKPHTELNTTPTSTKYSSIKTSANSTSLYDTHSGSMDNILSSYNSNMNSGSSMSMNKGISSGYSASPSRSVTHRVEPLTPNEMEYMLVTMDKKSRVSDPLLSNLGSKPPLSSNNTEGLKSSSISTQSSSSSRTRSISNGHTSHIANYSRPFASMIENRSQNLTNGNIIHRAPSTALYFDVDEDLRTRLQNSGIRQDFNARRNYERQTIASSSRGLPINTPSSSSYSRAPPSFPSMSDRDPPLYSFSKRSSVTPSIPSSTSSPYRFSSFNSR